MLLRRQSTRLVYGLGCTKRIFPKVDVAKRKLKAWTQIRDGWLCAALCHDDFSGRVYWSSGTWRQENVFVGLLNLSGWTSDHLGVSVGILVAPSALATASSVLRTCSSGDCGCCSWKPARLRHDKMPSSALGRYYGLTVPVLSVLCLP